MAHRKTTRSLKRSAGTRKPLRVIYIFCEGDKTEPCYFSALATSPEVKELARVNITIMGTGAVPLTLVRRAEAVDLTSGDVDEVWCVFDVESPKPHPHLDKALALSQTRGIRTVVSNPSFEVWLIYHHQNLPTPLTSSDAKDLFGRVSGATPHNYDGSWYVERRAVASDRARSRVPGHDAAPGCCPHQNPSTTMFDILDSLDL